MPRTISRGRPRDDEEQEERSERRGRSRDAEEEDERPRRSSRRSRDEDDDSPRRPRRSRDEEDEDRPARTRRRSGGDDEGHSESAPRPSNMGRGRASVRKHRETHRFGDFAPKFQVPDKEVVLIKFIDDDFFLTYYEHWIREFKGQRRQMSFVCLGKDNDCPLCDIGDEPKFTACINVIDLSDPSDPQVKVWYCTPNPAEAVEEAMDDEKYRPINRADLYYAVSKKEQKNKFTSYKLSLVKERDLEEDWAGMEPLNDDEIADLAAKAFTDDDCVRITPRRDMRDVADELSD